MSDPSYIRARQRIQAAIADSSNNQFVDECLNRAQTKVCRARRWPELMSRAFLNTEPAYETGTIAVTNLSTTITLTGGTFPTTLETSGFRFALGPARPWYAIRTRTSGTVAVLAEEYQDDTDASSGFIVYKSHYSLPSTVDRVEQMWLHNGSEARELENAVTDSTVTDFLHYPSGPGVPTHFMSIERDTSGNRQIILGPETPDDAYRVEYTYRRKAVDNQFGGNLDSTRWPVIEALAKSMAYEPEFYERHLQAEAEYERLLKKEWGGEGETEVQGFQIGEDRVRRRGGWPDGLIGYGTVAEPGV